MVKTSFQDEAFDLGIEIPEPLPAKAPKPGVTWGRYKARKMIHCDTCVHEVHVKWPNGTHAPNPAVYKRKENGEETYWCAAHAEPKRHADGVSRAKPTKKKREV